MGFSICSSFARQLCQNCGWAGSELYVPSHITEPPCLFFFRATNCVGTNLIVMFLYVALAIMYLKLRYSNRFHWLTLRWASTNSLTNMIKQIYHNEWKGFGLGILEICTYQIDLFQHFYGPQSTNLLESTVSTNGLPLAFIECCDLYLFNLSVFLPLFLPRGNLKN